MAKLKMDFKYEGVGYNGPHLAAMGFDQFKKEVGHHFKDGPEPENRMHDLYDKLQAKFPGLAATGMAQSKFVAPATEEEAAKPLHEREAKAPEAEKTTSTGTPASSPGTIDKK